MAEQDAGTRGRLEAELTRLHGERRGLAAALGGEDPADQDTGDRGDQANQLEGLDALAQLDRRIREVERLLAEQNMPRAAGPAADTVVTLRFDDGEESTFRIVTIPEDAPADEQDDVLTADSPLGRALVGHGAGDMVTYSAPDGEALVEVVAVRGPASGRVERAGS